MAKTYLEVKRRPIYILAESGGDAGLYANKPVRASGNPRTGQIARAYPQDGQAPESGRNIGDPLSRPDDPDTPDGPDPKELERILRELDGPSNI